MIKKIFYISLMIFFASVTVTLLDPRFAGPLTKDQVIEEQIRAGEKLYTEKKCDVCHGDRGNHPAGQDYPVLKGQSYAYLSNQIRDIVQGRRNNGLTVIMKTQIGDLNEQEIQALARYLSK